MARNTTSASAPTQAPTTKVLTIKGESRGVKSQQGEAITDEIYDKMSRGNKILINLCEMFTDVPVTVIKYDNGYGVAPSVLDALVEEFDLD